MRKGQHCSAEQRAKVSTALMGHPCSPETRAKIAARHRGRSLSMEHRAKLSAVRLGHPVSSATRSKIAAANFKGDAVGYGQAHDRAHAALPKVCAHCGAPARLDAALRHDAPPEHLKRDESRGCLYSPHPEDYIRLCRCCHWTYDRRAAR